MNEYPGANYDPDEMKRIALKLREEGLKDSEIAARLTALGWTSRRGTTLISDHARRLCGSRKAGTAGESNVLFQVPRRRETST